MCEQGTPCYREALERYAIPGDEWESLLTHLATVDSSMLPVAGSAANEAALALIAALVLVGGKPMTHAGWILMTDQDRARRLRASENRHSGRELPHASASTL